MRPVVIGTAGHIDHGKTALVRRLTGIDEKTALVHAGLEALIARAAARRLAALSGSMPDLTAVPRRRPLRRGR